MQAPREDGGGGPPSAEAHVERPAGVVAGSDDGAGSGGGGGASSSSAAQGAGVHDYDGEIETITSDANTKTPGDGNDDGRAAGAGHAAAQGATSGGSEGAMSFSSSIQQGDPQYAAMRTNMVETIMHILDQRKKHPMPDSRLREMAVRLEDYLWKKQSGDIEVYNDLSTVEARLELLAAQMGKILRAQQQGQQQQDKEEEKKREG